MNTVWVEFYPRFCKRVVPLNAYNAQKISNCKTLKMRIESYQRLVGH